MPPSCDSPRTGYTLERIGEKPPCIARYHYKTALTVESVFRQHSRIAYRFVNKV